MPVTPVYGLPYPSLSDPPNGPVQFQALANEVETELTRVDARIASDETLMAGFTPPAQVGSGSLASAAQATIMTVVIADPGFSYYVVASAGLGWAMAAATQPGNLIIASITVDSTVYNTNVLRQGFSVSHSLGAGFNQPTVNVAQTRSDSFGAFIGGKTIRLIARNSAAAATMTIVAAALDTALSVRIVRA